MFLGEKPSNIETHLRFGLHWHIDTENMRIIEGYGIFDFPEFFIQSGVDLFQRAHLVEQGINMHSVLKNEYYPIDEHVLKTE